MSTVEDLLRRFIIEHRASGAADPAPFLEQMSGVDRLELAAHIDRYLAEVPPPAFDAAAFARFRSDPARQALVKRIVDARTVKELRVAAGLSLANVGERLASALGLDGREQRVKGRYHDVEFGKVDPARVRPTVWQALGELFGTSPERIRSAAETAFAPGDSAGGVVSFARTASGGQMSAPPASPGAPTAEDDGVDTAFFID